MEVDVYCQDCSDEDALYAMQPEGALYLNEETKSQSQKYECPNCGIQVTVRIDTAKE